MHQALRCKPQNLSKFEVLKPQDPEASVHYDLSFFFFFQKLSENYRVQIINNP